MSEHEPKEAEEQAKPEMEDLEVSEEESEEVTGPATRPEDPQPHL